jgi:hypothetical protein
MFVSVYNKYEVSQKGEVRHKDKILIPTISKQGYHIRRAYGKTLSIHRLVAEAFIPNPEHLSDVDHINGIKSDNRVENLRWVSRSHNLQNSKGHSDSKSGIKGVSWSKQRQKWRVRICVDYKVTLIGVYDTIEEAIIARREAVANLFTCPHSSESN